MTIEPNDTVKIIVSKRRTVNRGNVKSFGSSQVNIGIEASVPLSNIEAEFKRCINYVDTTLETEMTKELTKLKQSVQTDADEDVTPRKPMQEPERSPALPIADDAYATLPWRTSKNDANLHMIRVNEKMPPLARELYKRLQATDKKTLRIGEASYKLWITPDAAEFLQRWAKPRGGK
jgi:hypothetical protein